MLNQFLERKLNSYLKFEFPKKESQLIYLNDKRLSFSEINLFGNLPKQEQKLYDKLGIFQKNILAFELKIK